MMSWLDDDVVREIRTRAQMIAARGNGLPVLWPRDTIALCNEVLRLRAEVRRLHRIETASAAAVHELLRREDG